MKKIKLRNESGMALVITMGILLLVTLLAVGFFSSQYTERNASTNYRYSVVAEQIADAGFNHALLLLFEDRDNTTPNGTNGYWLFDAPFELWGPKYTGNDDRRLSFQGGNDIGANLDEIITGSNHSSDENARWIDIKDDMNIPMGRYIVLVMPENGKIDINSAGANQFSTLPAVVQGYTTYEISLYELFNEIDSLPSFTSNAQRIVNWRFTGNAANAGGPGIDGIDDDGNNGYLENDKIDNNGDGVIDEPDEGEDDPYEYFHIFGNPNYAGLLGNDFRYAGTRMVGIAWSDPDDAKNDYRNHSLGTLLTADSYENDLIDFTGKERIRLNKYSFPYQLSGSNNADAGNKKTHAETIRNVFQTAGMPANLASQLAVNIVDYGDYDVNPDTDIRADVRTQIDSGDPGKPYLGVEKTVYINEVNGASFNSTDDPFLDRDADNDFIELINTSEKDINLNGWRVVVGGRTFTFGDVTISGYSGWGNPDNIIVLAVEKGPDPIQYDSDTGLPIAPVMTANGYYTGNGNSFMDNIGGDDSRVIEASVLGPGLGATNRITLYDNNNNIVDVVDSTDSVDDAGGAIKTWQKDDPTTEIGANGDKNHTALNYNDNADPTDPNMWLDAGELKHIKDRYFSSVAEIGAVTGSVANWEAFVPKGTIPGGTSFDSLLAIFDKFTIAQEFDASEIMAPLDGSSKPIKFGIGPRITQITPDGVGGNVTNEQALAYGRISINTIIDAGQAPIFSAIRFLGGNMNSMYGNISNVLKSGNGFGEPDASGYFAGLGGIGMSRMKIEEFASISNLLTTKSNVFKIIVIAQAYDRKFAIASERKLEVIVDRGYNIDPSAPGYSSEAKEKAKRVRVLSYRWITEE